ncbi:MAG: CapA family protein [Phycisphaerae bacterium]|nr:CapA family protein [Phycisphaerae bacterium]
MTKTRNSKQNSSVEVLVTGDLCPDKCGYANGTGRMLNESMEDIFGRLAGTMKNADVVVANLEAPLVAKGKPIIKCGPNLKADPKFAQAMKRCGYDVANLANNHIRDFGPEGVVSTVRELEKVSIPYFGVGRTAEEASKPLFMTRKGLKIGFLAFAENEFGVVDEYGWGAASMDPAFNGEAVQAASKQCDVLLVFLHGSSEYFPHPSPGMIKRYRYYARCGASAVIVSHAHIPQGWEIYQKIPIFYCLGNFMFPWPTPPNARRKCWTQGLAVRLFLSKTKPVKFEVIPLQSQYDKVSVDILPPARRKAFEKHLQSLCKTLQQPKKLQRLWHDRYVDRGSNLIKRIRNLPEGYRSHADLMQWAILENMFRCETHHEIVMKYLHLLRNRNISKPKKA